MERRQWDWLRGEVRHAAQQFAQQLDTIDDTSVQVPNLAWSVAELGQHLASLPRLYEAQNEIGVDFEPPTDWAEFSVAVRSHLDDTDAATLGRLIIDETERLLSPREPDEAFTLYGQPTTVANTAAGMLTELILHGRDLGALTGDRPMLRRDQALAGLEQQMALAPAFVDPVTAAPLAGVYGLHFRGGADFTYRIDDSGRLTTEHGRPKRADARLHADPAAFILHSLGRVTTLSVAARGQIIAYGRKPWRLLMIGDTVVDGV